ncbi:MAG TPA: LamG-like jellyroll fold domain-containing protein [Kofleriaceae bacterium]|nr:LamG-like jellyroll fold domain-containing protein [Kofleriaceae bacterium]
MSLRRSVVASLLLLAPGCALFNASGDDGAGSGDGTVRLVVPAGRVDADLERYPLLVQLAGAGELIGAPDDGGDLEFVQDGEVLPHDLEAFDAGDGTLVAWVLVPLLAADSDNLLTVRRAGEPRDARAADVWADYRGVWHLADDQDATGQGALAAESGELSHDDAMIAGGVALAGGYLDMGEPEDDHLDFTLEDSFSISMWLRRDASTGTWQEFLSKGGTTQGETGYSIETTEDAEEIYACMADDDSYWCTDDAILPDGWVLAHYVIDRPDDEMRLYIDGRSGSQDDEIFDVDPDFEGNDHTLRVGATPDADNIVSGAADELRIREGILSPEWIAADAASQSDPGFVERAGD